MAKRFKEKDRVRYTGPSFLGPAPGSIGTVAKVAGARGKSIHPDPSRIMTFVNWDDWRGEGVFTKHLEKI